MDASKLFTHTKKVIYFNHASSSPLPNPTRNKMKALVDELEFGDLSWGFWDKQLAAFRTQSANLLGASPAEIGFVPNTSHGLLIALYSIPWQKGDNIVYVKDCFPANVVPWEHNLPHIEKRWVKIDKSLEQRVIDATDERTRAVAVDWVDFFTGYRIDLGMLGEFCRHKGIFLVVDGIQGAGALELDLSALHVDFFTAGSAKWLLGPVGAGILYVNEETLGLLKPAFEGWMSLDWQDFNIFDPLPLIKQGAGRFEPGSYPGVPLVGFLQNLKILNSVGITEINKQIFKLRHILLEGLRDLDAEIISPPDEAHASGILTFRLPGKDSKALYDRLTQSQIVCSLRKNAIRLSPHFYNTSDEAIRVLEVIKDFNRS
jgi:cysteine desulfurase/selenocysteine lyase